MVMTNIQKAELKQRIVACLSVEKEVRKIVIFGSFLHNADPHDIDVAVYQESDEGYLPLALRYRRAVRAITHVIPLDIIPLRYNAGDRSSSFLAEIEQGEVVYER